MIHRMMKLKKTILFSFRKSQIGWLLVIMHLFYILEKAKISYEMKTLVPIAEVLIYQKIKPRLFIT